MWNRDYLRAERGTQEASKVLFSKLVGQLMSACFYFILQTVHIHSINSSVCIL